MPDANDFRDELHRIMLGAMKSGEPYVEINAGKLHRRVGDYPGRNHRMPVCCQVMRAAYAPDAGDVIVAQPPKGDGASLTIRYALPRFVPMPI